MNNARNGVFDVARALCVLYIVAFWHLLNYFPSIKLNGMSLQVCSSITIVVLGTFTFMSGFFLKKYVIETLDDVKLFYWKRFKRFYIPYLVCLTVLFLGGWFESGKQFVLSLIGLSTYIGSSPNTVWYFSMLMSFYALTPILLYLKKRNHFYFYALTFGLICLYVLFSRINGMYFPFYLLGILITDKRLKVLTSKWIYIITFMISFILLLYVQDKWGVGLLICRYFLIFCGIFLIVKLSQSLCCNASLKFWNLLAYSSMMAYLYHRIHYKIIGFIISPDGITSIILFAIMGVISLFLISYWLQKIYDNFSRKYMG